MNELRHGDDHDDTAAFRPASGSGLTGCGKASERKQMMTVSSHGAPPVGRFHAGQGCWPDEPARTGTIVFDGCVTPPFGRIPDEPIRLTVKDGIITAVDGGEDARTYEEYLRNFNDPGMLMMAHISYGFNPGAQLTGNIVEDERVWGATEWGIGYVSDVDAPPCGQDAVSHTDGICLRSTVWLDERCILREGVVIDPELAALSPKK